MKPSFVDMVVSHNKPMDLPTDQFFSPTYLPDAAEHLVALAIGPSNGIYHLVNQGKTNWMEFARMARRTRKIKGVEQWDDSDMMEFLEAYVSEHITPKLGGGDIANAQEDEDVPF